MTSSPQQLGFIGLGIMGAPMALHLVKAGHALFVHTRSRLPPQIEASSATQCSSAQDVAERADVILNMLPGTPDVETVLFGKDGVAAGLTKGKTVIDISSISPIETKAFAQKINPRVRALELMAQHEVAKA